MPAGWKFEKVFGSKTPVKETIAFKAIAASAKPRVHDAQKLLALPQGSTPADLLLIIGLLISLAGGASLVASRRMAS